ncbi:MAG: hypothetical protein RJA98_3930 [Pseudomonadota bacterium]
MLNSERAVEVSVHVVRAFVHLRQLAAGHADLAQRLAELEQQTEALAMQHDTFSRNTRAQLKQVFETLRQLTQPDAPPSPPKRPIGFILPPTDETSSKASNEARDAEMAPANPRRQRPTR